MRYALDPSMPVLLRPDGAVQIGWDPRRAVLVCPPTGLTPSGLAAVLRALGAPMPLDMARRLAVPHGLEDSAGFSALLDDLVAAGVLRGEGADDGRRALSIRVHGGGPLSELLTEGLRCSGARVSRTSHANAAGAAAGVDLVVLADFLAADPRLVRDLQSAGVPHLPVRVRDGAGIVGPLVIPGLSSCLSCVELYRTDRDPAWPALAAQLREMVGTADRPTLLATAALALDQVQQIIAGVRGAGATPPAAPAPPATLNATLEIDVASSTISARRWVRHPLCGCWPEPRRAEPSAVRHAWGPTSHIRNSAGAPTPLPASERQRRRQVVAERDAAAERDAVAERDAAARPAHGSSRD
jgi:bacteriocin biosynthesis cyclodehydratase domain-containing protein